MKTAFELAVMASYYLGVLCDKATDPNMSLKKNAEDYLDTPVQIYAEIDKKQVVPLGSVAARISGIFSMLADHYSSAMDDKTAASLKNTVSSLNKMANLSEPKGYSQYFKALQDKLKAEMSAINNSAQVLGLEL